MPRRGEDNGAVSITAETYPAAGTFGKLLDWHLRWGTRPGCSKTIKNDRWIYRDFAELVHVGAAKTKDQNNPERKLRFWREGRYLPESDVVIRNIFNELFKGDASLADWKSDLEHTLEIEQKQKAGAKTPSARSEATSKEGLPRQATYFVGRVDDVRILVEALISSDEGPAMLVQGGPGIGKTELTKAVAHHASVAERFGNRRFFVPLETASTAEAMQDAIVCALGCDPALGFPAAVRSLQQAPTLLILDNLETPWEPTEQRECTHRVIADLAEIGGVSLLASFRGKELVGGAKWTGFDVDPLDAAAAIELFVCIGGPRFREDPNLNEFLTALGGIPLAIDLVARLAYVRRSLAPLWREWISIGTELAVDPDFAEGRLTSLSHSLELSLRSVRMKRSLPAQRLFSLLGQLPAGLCKDDLRALLRESAFDAEQKLLRVGLAFERSGRVDLLPPIREHAHRHYPPENEDAENWVKHFLMLTEETGSKVGYAEGIRSFPLIRDEFFNIEAAFKISIASDQQLSLMSALSGLGRISAIGSMTTSVFSEVAAFCHAEGDTRGEAHCNYWAGEMAFARSDFNMAKIAYEAALSLYQAAQDTTGRANCIFGMGEIAFVRANNALAGAGYEEALSLYERTGDARGIANCMSGLGDIAYSQRDFDTARAAYESALPLYRDIGYLLGEATCTSDIGTLSFYTLDYETAYAFYDRALQLYRTVGFRKGEANSICHLGDIALAQSKYQVAQEAYDEALPLYRQTNYILGEANCLCDIGNLAYARLDLDAANEAFQKAILLYRQIDAVRGEAGCLWHMGRVAFVNLRYSEAEETFEQALRLYKQIADGPGEESCRHCLKTVSARRSEERQLDDLPDLDEREGFS